MHSPCTGCVVTLEHDGDPRTVLCGGCERDRYDDLFIILPPPTTEWHKAPTGNNSRVGLMLLAMLIWMLVGMAMGWKMAGGV